MGRRRKRGAGKQQPKAAPPSPDERRKQAGKKGKPKKEVAKEPEKTKGKGDGAKEKNRGVKANMVVLLDNDPDYVEMESLAVVNYLSGYNPMGFTVPSRALNYINNPRNEGRIGLVILSLEAVQEDGPAMDEIIAAMRKKGNIPLALVSEYNSAENVEKVTGMDAVGFLPKVFTMEIFVRFVKNVLRNGYANSWQCSQCGKLLSVDQTDMLSMRPIKCSDKNCNSYQIDEVEFGS